MKKCFTKFLLSIMLVFAAVLTLGLQNEADAAAATSVKVNGYTLNSGYYMSTSTWAQTTAQPSGGYFYYSNGTLTINNVTVTSSSGTRTVDAEGDLVVNISGTNTLTATGANVIRANGTLKFTGSGSLTVNGSGQSSGIYSVSNMEFAHTGNIIATSTYASAVSCGADMTIGGNLTATSESYAIYSYGDLTMTNGTVNANGNCTYSYGGIRVNGEMTVSGGNLTVNSKYDGIVTVYNFFQKGGNVTVNADGNGIYVQNTTTNNIIIHSGVMTVTAAKHGIWAQKFFMNGGRGYIKSTNTSSDSSYCAVKLYANSSACFSMKGNVRASGSTTTSSSGLTTLSYSELPNYDYVFFTGYVMVNGVRLENGHYLKSDGTTTSTGKPTSGGYAYYSGNTLTLNNYSGTNTDAHGIYSGYDLIIQQEAGSTNKLITTSAEGTSYCGIKVSGSLTIKGLGSLSVYGGKYAVYSSSSLTLSSTQLLAYGGGIYSGGIMTFSYGYVNVRQLGSAAAGTHAIESASTINISDGAVVVNSPTNVNGNFVRGIVGKGITINSSVEVTPSGLGIYSSGNLSINGGDIKVTAKNGSGMYATGDMYISDGTVNVSANNDGLYANKLIIRGGQITSVSTHATTDSGNSAVDVANNTATYFEIPSTYAFIANVDPTSSYNTGKVADLDEYDYVRIGDFLMLHDVELKSGYYLAGGNSANTPSTTKPSDNKYAYYNDGVLTLNNYEYSGNLIAVRSYADLEIKLSETNKINHIISGAGDITFSGNGNLELKRNMAPYAVNTPDDIYIQKGVITVEASGGDGFYCNNFNMSGGNVWVNVLYNGITIKNGLNITGGAITLKSTTTANDTSYKAIYSEKSSPTVYLKSGLNHMVGTTSNPDIMSNTNYTGGDYDFVSLGEFVMVRGVILQKGYYLKNGSTSPVRSVSGTGYARVINVDKIELKDYNFSGSEFGIASNVDLTVMLTGSNSIESKTKSTNIGGSGYAVVLCDGIFVNGNLVIEGNSTAVDSLTVKSEAGNAIYTLGNITVKGENITAAAGGVSTVVSGGSFTMTGGTMTVTSTRQSTSNNNAALDAGGNLTVSAGTLNVTAAANSGDAIHSTGNINVSGGITTATAINGNGIVANTANLSITGGELYVEAYYNAIQLKQGRLNMNNGFLSAASAYAGSSDTSYAALKLVDGTSNHFNVSGTLAQAASVDSTSSARKELEHLPTALKSYTPSSFDFVQIGNYILVEGNTLKSGYSISSNGVIEQGNKGKGYAYYSCDSGNTLTFNDFDYTSTQDECIEAFADLTISVTKYSILRSENYPAFLGYGNFTFTGSELLQLTNSLKIYGNATFEDSRLRIYSPQADGEYAIYVSKDLDIKSGSLDITADNSAIYAKNVTVSGGLLYIEAQKNGVHIPNGYFTMTDGLAKISSKNTTADNTYCAIKLYSSDYYKVSASVSGSGSLSNTGGDAEKIVPANLNSYDYVIIGTFVIIDGTVVRNGYSYTSSGSLMEGKATISSVYFENTPDGNVLTLNDYMLTTTDNKGIEAYTDLTIVIQSSNSISAGDNTAIYVDGNVLFKNSDVSYKAPHELNLSSDKVALRVTGDIVMDNAFINITSTDFASISADGLVTVKESTNLNITSQSSGIYADGVTINSESIVKIEVEHDGICIDSGNFTMTDGFVTIVSKSSSSDYSAIKLSGKVSEKYKVNSALKQVASMNNTLTPPFKLNASGGLGSYDCIVIGSEFVIVGGVVVPNYFYLEEGSTTPTDSAVSSKYVYLENGLLNMNNFSYQGEANGIFYLGDLELGFSGNNSITTESGDVLCVDGNLTINGKDNLTVNCLKSTIDVSAVKTTGNLYMEAGSVTLTSEGCGISVLGSFIEVNGGTLNITAAYHCIEAPKYTQNNGNVTTTSPNHIPIYLGYEDGVLVMNGGNLNVDGSYRGITTDSATFNGGTSIIKSNTLALNTHNLALGSGMIAMGSTGSNGTNLQQIANRNDLNDIEYLKVEKCKHSDATTDSDHNCDFCGKNNITSHVTVELNYDDSYHWGVCNCGQAIESTKEAHTFGSNGTSAYCDHCDYVRIIGNIVSGTLTTFGKDSDKITIHLIPSGASEVAYEEIINGDSASYRIINVENGTYTLKVTKRENEVYQATVTVNGSSVVHNVTMKAIFRIAAASLSLQENISINFKAVGEAFTAYGYTDPYLLVTVNGEETKLDTWTVEKSTGRYVFKFNRIAPNMIGDSVSAVLYAKNSNGTLVQSQTINYGVKTYCQSQLKKSIADSFRTVIVDLLNYGAAAQNYTSYKTNDLANAFLQEDAYKSNLAYASTTLDLSSFNGIAKSNYETVANPKVQMHGANLALSDSVTIRFIVSVLNVSDFEGLKIQISKADGSYTWEFDATDKNVVEFYKAQDGRQRYYVRFKELNATEMSDVIYLKFVDSNGNPVSNTLRYSIGCYAYSKQNDTTTPGLAEMVKAMMKYGNATKAWNS